MSTDKNGHIEDDQPTQVIDIDALRLSKERAAGLYDLELEKNDAKDSMSTIDSPSTSKYTTATVRISAIVFVILVLLFVCLMEYLSVSGYLSLYSNAYNDEQNNCNSGLISRKFCDSCSTPDISSTSRMSYYISIIEIKNANGAVFFCLGTMIDRATVVTSFSCLSTNLNQTSQKAILSDVKSFRGRISAYSVNVPENKLDTAIDIDKTMTRFNVIKVTEIRTKNKNGSNVLVLELDNNKPLSHTRYSCVIAEPVLDMSNITLGLVITAQVVTENRSLVVDSSNFIYLARDSCPGCKFGSFWLDLSDELKSGENKGIFANAMTGSPYFLLSDMGNFDVIGALN